MSTAGRWRCRRRDAARDDADRARRRAASRRCVHDPSLADEPELLDAVTAAAEIALENARLHAELRARLEELGARGPG